VELDPPSQVFGATLQLVKQVQPGPPYLAFLIPVFVCVLSLRTLTPMFV